VRLGVRDRRPVLLGEQVLGVEDLGGLIGRLVVGRLGLLGRRRGGFLGRRRLVELRFGRDPGAVRLAAALLFAAAVTYLLVWTWRGGDWVRAAAWTALALLLATAWLLPWYLVWVLPLAAISRDRPLQLLTLALTAYQLGARIPL